MNSHLTRRASLLRQFSLALALAGGLAVFAENKTLAPISPTENTKPTAAKIERETRLISGWSVHIDKALLAQNPAGTARALELLVIAREP